MKPKFLIAIALSLGAMAAFLVSRWIGIGVEKGSGSAVVMAANRIEPGTTISALQVKSVNWPAGNLPPGAVSDPDSVIGRIARQEIMPGEPVLEGKLAPPASKGGLTSMITEGKRAISIQADEIIGVAGFTLPGSYVDVIANTKGQSGEALSRIVLSRVKVLAIAQETSGDPSKPKVVKAVTLELTPEEAEKLDLARSIGKLSLALRNDIDTAPNETIGASEAALFGRSLHHPKSQAQNNRPMPVKNSAPPRNSSDIEEIRGMRRSRNGS